MSRRRGAPLAPPSSKRRPGGRSRPRGARGAASCGRKGPTLQSPRGAHCPPPAKLARPSSAQQRTRPFQR
eukprot:9363231-Lingulodinium_polyedra.AAC.1